MTKSPILTDEHVAANFEMQLSGYYSGKVQGPDNSFYFYSESIPSLSWNHSVQADPSKSSHLEFVTQQASSRSRTPTFFVRESELERVTQALGDKGEVARERWMICTSETLNQAPQMDDLAVTFSHDSSPTNDYCQVLERLFDDDDLNDRFKKYYVPTLKRSKLRGETSVCHAVGYVAGAPVACGSYYRIGKFSGLYSVGTVASKQKQGYGREISRMLTQSALNEGAEDIFLQCVIGTHVERLYSSIGYISVEQPGLISL
ncbi:MAG: hypothetical protein AAFQ10_03945 [Pseudomonadota bacterium]